MVCHGEDEEGGREVSAEGHRIDHWKGGGWE
jgi:hypothetical protein